MQDKEGQKRTSFEIVATNFRMLGGRGDGMAAGASAGEALPRPAVVATTSDTRPPRRRVRPSSGPEISDEDIPF